MKYLFHFFVLLIFISCKSPAPNPPAPFGPLPSPGQYAWQQMEMNMFIHFNINTFTNMEWGTGAESPSIFNPTSLDTRQWAAIAKRAGMKGIIITAKHHDGFCLWPSDYTEHSIKNSPWKDGKGDLLAELSEACKEYGLKFGVYLSPWDRNHPEYGTASYLEYFRKQMEEIFINYGEVFEFWIDGANGGTGYYGGANENRKIDRRTYYEWDSTFDLAFKFNPNIIIFSDGGPGCRWVGNEQGFANETNWSLLRGNDVYPGYANYKELTSGHADGDTWIPAEVNVSIRPGWYYHEYEDHKVKSVETLVNMYYESQGRNGLWLLNFPVDKSGLIHPIDSANIINAMDVIREDLKTDLSANAHVEVTSVRGNSDSYGPKNLIDDDPDTYWTTDDETTTAAVTLTFPGETTLNRLLIQEDIRLGQRVEEFTVEVKQGDKWIEIEKQTTIGYKRILRFNSMTGSAVRINITKSRACPVISNIKLFNAPPLVVPPTFSRSKEGLVTLTSPAEGLGVYYTLDGTRPNNTSQLYTGSLDIKGPATLKAISIDLQTDRKSDIITERIDIAKKNIQVIFVSSGDLASAEKIVDENRSTWWETATGEGPEEIIIDLGEEVNLKGITYLPTQQRYPSGFIQDYEVFLSQDGENFGDAIARGEFGNILNSPIEQLIEFEPQKAQFVKFRSLSPIQGHNTAGFAELGFLTTFEQ